MAWRSSALQNQVHDRNLALNPSFKAKEVSPYATHSMDNEDVGGNIPVDYIGWDDAKLSQSGRFVRDAMP